MELLKNVAELIGALTVVVGALIAFEKWSKGMISRWLLKPILTQLKSMDNRADKMEIDLLKIIIMSDSIPIEERIQAGERYLAKGGNGAIKVQVHVLQEKYQENLKEGF